MRVFLAIGNVSPKLIETHKKDGVLDIYHNLKKKMDWILMSSIGYWGLLYN